MFKTYEDNIVNTELFRNISNKSLLFMALARFKNKDVLVIVLASHKEPPSINIIRTRNLKC